MLLFMMNLKCELHFTEIWDLLNPEFRKEPNHVKLIIFTVAVTVVSTVD